MNVVVEITGLSHKSFDLRLSPEGFYLSEGNWRCLPGYLPLSKGYYTLDDEELVLYDRDLTIGEMLGVAILDDDSPNKLFAWLKKFSMKKGKTGIGSIYQYGKLGADVLRDTSFSNDGYAYSEVTWNTKTGF